MEKMSKTQWGYKFRGALLDLQNALKSEVAARSADRASERQWADSSATYSAQHIEGEIAAIKARAGERNNALYKRVLELIDALAAAVDQRYAEGVDLSDQALATALNLIALAGPKISPVELGKLVEQFRGDPAALRMLRAVFENHEHEAGIALVNGMLYSADDVRRILQSAAGLAFLNQQSLNAFASYVSGFAQKEGETFPLDNAGMLDPEGLEVAMWQAAGLPQPD